MGDASGAVNVNLRSSNGPWFMPRPALSVFLPRHMWGSWRRINRMKTEGTRNVSRRRALLALGVLVFLLLVPLPHPAEPRPFVENLQNLVHVPLFMAITLLLRAVQLSLPPRGRSLWICAMAAALLGVVSELLQGLTGRTPAVGDLGADLGGILLACGWLLRGAAPRMTVLRMMLLLAGGGMFALTARPLVGEIAASVAKRKAFPVLLDTAFPGGLWKAQGSTRIRVDGGGLLVEMARGDYEGLRYLAPRGGDTAGYSSLVLETDNDSEPFELGVRIDLDSGLRRNAAVTVPQGKALLNVDWASAPGDGGLRRVVLFTGVEQPARRFHLLGARLARPPRD